LNYPRSGATWDNEYINHNALKLAGLINETHILQTQYSNVCKLNYPAKRRVEDPWDRIYINIVSPKNRWEHDNAGLNLYQRVCVSRINMNEPKKRKITIKIFVYMCFSFTIANVLGIMAFVPFVLALNAGRLSNVIGALVFIAGVILYLIVFIFCYKWLYRQLIKDDLVNK